MATTDRPILRVNNAADLLALVPYLVGFHLESSLLILALDGRRILLTARLDLPTPGSPAAPMEAALGRLAATMATRGATGAILVGYGTAEQVEPATDTTVLALAGAGIRL